MYAHAYLIQQLSFKDIATMGSMNTMQIISEIIKRIKTSSGSERDEILNSVRKHFQVEEGEKWVVTKLRMILFRMKGDIETFHLSKSKNPKKSKSKSKRQSGGTNDLRKSKRESSKTESKRSSTLQKPLKIQTNAKRLTLEEKQLNKLRKQTFPEKKLHSLPTSKLAYLKAYGLEPNVICL